MLLLHRRVRADAAAHRDHYVMEQLVDGIGLALPHGGLDPGWRADVEVQVAVAQVPVDDGTAKMVSRPGLGPGTPGLKVRCSAS